MMIYLMNTIALRVDGSLSKFSLSRSDLRPKLRLEHELDLNRKKIDHEAVLMDAANEAALFRAHMRYFYYPQILERIRGAME